jgi:5'-nucleotidase
MRYNVAAEIAGPMIDAILRTDASPQVCININIPTAAIEGKRDVVVVPMQSISRGQYYVEGQDPKHRKYYWSTHGPPPKIGPATTDEEALRAGKITVTPLDSNLTCDASLQKLATIDFEPD